MKRSLFRIMAAAVLIATIAVSAAAAPQMLIPGGCTIGIKLQADGLVVTGFDTGSAARKAGLRKGDVIIAVDGEPVHTAQMLREHLSDKAAVLTVRRSGQDAAFSVTPKDRQIGAYVRDSVSGIGTVTYYDPNTGAFGALGHGVCGANNDDLIPMQTGVVVHASVSDVRKGEHGAPGELKGDFDVSRILGEVSANESCGIFGVLSVPIAGEPLPVASVGDAQVGSAQILSSVRGSNVQAYTVEILKLYPHAEETGRNMLLQVTDPALLNTTGGIVQGMSGSPVIQNGRIVGAVTHVLVNDPTRGYGIFIENMLEAAE